MLSPLKQILFVCFLLCNLYFVICLPSVLCLYNIFCLQRHLSIDETLKRVCTTRVFVINSISLFQAAGRHNLRRYRGIQEILDKRVFANFRDKNYVFELHDNNTVFGFNFVCSGQDQSIDSQSVLSIANLLYRQPTGSIDNSSALSIANLLYRQPICSIDS